MKHSVFYLLAVLVFTSCHSQPGKEMALKQKEAIESIKPGTIAAKAGSWTMTATIDGKAWTASSLMPPEAAGRIIGYYKDSYIGLPYWRNGMITGQKTTFAKDNAVDLWPVAGNDFWGGREGAMEITKVTGDWVEGSFHFTADCKNTSQKIAVTNGFFRIAVSTRF